MKVIVTILFFLMYQFDIKAETKEALFIYSGKSDKVCFVLEEKPSVRILKNEVVIFISNKYISYSLSDNLKFKFEQTDYDTGITSTKSEPTFRIKESILNINNAFPYTNIYLFDIQGRLLKMELSTSKGCCCLSLIRGKIYIIKIGKIKFKIRI